MYAISLFASSGIGDLALKELGINILLSNELLHDRCELHKSNFPKTDVLEGDIWLLQDVIVKHTKEKLGRKDLDILFASPPCQGMSKNGQGKLLQGIRDGIKDKFDARNQLIIPTLNIACALQPKIIVFENVPEMENTMILDEEGSPVNIIDYIRRRLGKLYVGGPRVVQFADYGVPQRRSRLITIFTKDEKLINHYNKYGTFFPSPKYSKNGGNNQKKHKTVRDTIGNLPVLDAKDEESAKNESMKYHFVPVLDEKKYFWISNTPKEKGAFDNQCINPKCLYQKNPTHASSKDKEGINRSHKDTPLYCIKCGELLPRPYTIEKDGTIRLMSGFTSAYKRMSRDLPSSTLTTNLFYPSSDHKLHPEQNRVLSLYEAMKLHTLDVYGYKWEFPDGKLASTKTITESIGESIPPLGLQVLMDNVLKVYRGDIIHKHSKNLFD